MYLSFSIVNQIKCYNSRNEMKEKNKKKGFHSINHFQLNLIKLWIVKAIKKTHVGV